MISRRPFFRSDGIIFRFDQDLGKSSYLPVLIGYKRYTRKPLEPFLFRGRTARGNDQEIKPLPPVEDRLEGFS